MENRTKQSIQPMDDTTLAGGSFTPHNIGNQVDGVMLHRVFSELVTDISLIEASGLKTMLNQFRVPYKTTELLNADLQSKSSNYELVEFTSDQLDGLQIAIIPHGVKHDNDILTFVAEEANRPDLLNLEG